LFVEQGLMAAMFVKALEKLAAGLSRTRQRLVGSLKSMLTGRELDEGLLEELEAKLIQADIGVAAAARIRADLQAAYKDKRLAKAEEILDFLKAELKSCWPPADRSMRFAETPPTVILVAGINGTGKTTSVATLAWQFKQEGKKVVLGAADTFRAAAVEQLTIWADRIGVEIIKGAGDPAAVAFDACEAAKARNADILLVDTAGRLHTQDHLMRELTKIRNVVSRRIPGAPHEVLLVLDATTGQNAINQAKAFADAVDVTGIFLAKLDGTAKGGIVVAIRNEVNLPVKFVGIGETYEDIEPFDPDRFVEALFA
jgi:fused signal recognition particle receptor